MTVLVFTYTLSLEIKEAYLFSDNFLESYASMRHGADYQ